MTGLLLDGCVFQDWNLGHMMHDSGFTELAIVFDLPSISLLVVNELGSIVTLVHILEDC